MKKTYKLLVLFFLILATVTCKKLKVDENLPVTNVLQTINSSVRLIALSSPYSVTARINGFTYDLTPGLQSLGGPIYGFAPVPFVIPNKILDINSKARIQLQISGPSGITYKDTMLTDDPVNPKDYYVNVCSPYSGGCNIVTTSITVIPRSNTPPASPSSFKLRILNLTPRKKAADVLSAPFTLVYADGSTVSAATTRIDTMSAYVDIPYGAYQFKVLNDLYNELSEGHNPGKLYSGSGIFNADSVTGQLVSNPQQVFASIHNFEPGGIYTVVIFNDFTFTYLDGTSESALRGYSLNAYNVITDFTPAVNNQYARVQFVNAIPSSSSASGYLDGVVIKNAQPFRGATDYEAVPIGTHQVRIDDGEGNTITTNVVLHAYDNVSIWGFSQNGMLSAIFSNNDMAMTSLQNRSLYSDPYSVSGFTKQIRFLNLSDDVSNITFTEVVPFRSPLDLFVYANSFEPPSYNDTTSPARATQALSQGFVASFYPYAYSNTIRPSNSGLPFHLFQSFPGPPAVIPGNLLSNIAPLTGANFIANPSLYNQGFYNGVSPTATGEPGIYTVALMGKNNYSDSSQKARLVVVKHNR